MTDYIIQFDLKEQNQTEHSRFLGQQSAFFFKKKKKSFLRKTVQTLVIQKIFTGLFFFLKNKTNKKQRERAL